ncbi:Peptidyl-tRNA hydrolase ict1, mitochondrial [Mortierella sp. NVP85]|nr:Peptidyl-tRNA hydrolase ict1, mitochondrial [Mortierella sp. NVP85]
MTLTQMHPSTQMIYRAQGILPCQWVIQERRRGFASSSGSEEEEEEEEFRDENGMTMKEREKIEKWAQNFSKDSIPKGLLTLNFVRSSGPGGQNVNKGKSDRLESRVQFLNTKVDMRFVVDEAMWLPEYVRGRLKSEEGNKINKSGEYVLSSDSKRTQMANMDDCMEKLHAVLLRMAKLPTLPDAEALAKLERM